MKRDRIFLFFRIAFVMVLSVSFSIMGLSIIKNNGSGGTYGDGTDGTTDGKRTVGVTGIESYVIKGAGYCLAADISIKKMLYSIEILGTAGMDGESFRADLADAVANMKNAVATYDLLVQTAEVTPYNPVVIQELVYFDYYGYYWRHNLNYTVFNIVKNYLGQGDVTGIYRRSRTKMEEVLNLLVYIDGELTAKRYPAIDYFLMVHEKSSEEALFGSYVARVFKEINL